MTRHDQPDHTNTRGTSVVAPVTTKSYRPPRGVIPTQDDVSPVHDPDHASVVLQNGGREIWLSGDTAQAIGDRALSGETPEGTLRRLFTCLPCPRPDLSRIEPCDAGGVLLYISQDFTVELVMRMCPSSESQNSAIRRLLIQADIRNSRNFRVFTTEERRWIGADREVGNDRDPRKRGGRA